MAKTAIRRLKRGPDGLMKTIFIDVDTGKELSDLTGYTVADTTTDSQLKEVYKGKLPTKTTPPTKEQCKENPDLPGCDIYDEEIKEEPVYPETGGPPLGDATGPTGTRDITNNFGYIDKPMALSLTGMLPGVLGLSGKVINAVINANNTQAVAAGKKALGLPDLSPFDVAKGVARDNKGYVGDIVIGDEQYAVGFEGLTPDGRTTLTVAEAQQRSKTLGKSIAQAPEEVVEAAKADHATKGKTGLLERLGFKSPLGLEKGWFGKTIEKQLGLDDKPTEIAKSEDKGHAYKGRSFTAPVSEVTRGPISDETQVTSTGREITPGAGLANLTARTDLVGKGRNVAPDQRLMDVVQQATVQALGPGYTAVVSSGTYSPEVLAAINQGKTRAQRQALGQVGTERHNTGKAGDFYITDPKGNKVTSTEALKAIADQLAQLGITGLGLGKPGGYMGGQSIHADTVRDDSVSGWGGLGQGFKEQMQDSLGMPDAFSPNGIPVPADKPTVVGDIKDAIQQGFNDLTSVNSAQAAEMTRDDKAMEKLAYTIAGELGSKTLTGVASGDPKAIMAARQEIAAIMSTIDNRSKSEKQSLGVEPLSSVLTPNNYNSLASSNSKITGANFSKFGDFIKNAIEDYDMGANPSPAPNATHYRSVYMDAPAWETNARDKSLTQVGEHIFSDVLVPGTNISEYQRALPQTAPTPTSNPTFTGSPDTGGPGGLGGNIGTGSSGSTGGGTDTGGSPSPGSVDTIGYNDGFDGGRETGSFSQSDGIGGRETGGVTTSSHGPGAGDNVSGAFGNAMGSGFGSPSTAGATAENVGAGFGSARSGETSFGGRSAGSLAGSASGFGTGFGGVGTSGKTGGFDPVGRGTIGVTSMSTGQTSKGGVPSGLFGPTKQEDEKIGPQSFNTTTTHSYTAGYGMSNTGVGSGGGSSSGGGFAGSSGGGRSSGDLSPGYGSEPGSFGGGEGSGGTKVLCTYFYETGKLSENLYNADSLYAEININKYVQEGYAYWAMPIVKYLKTNNHPYLEKFLFFFVSKWASEMAYRMGVIHKSNILGRIMCTFGEPLCGLIGKFRAT